MSDEYKPWEGNDIKESLPQRKTVDPDEALKALEGIREKMGGVLKKDQALKISMHTPEHEKKQPTRKEGEVWEENGKKYEWKHGVKQSVSKLQSAKTPVFCPKCEKLLRGRLDSKMQMLHGMCHDCWMPNETRMRLDGTWDAYERHMMLSNAIDRAKDVIQEFRGYQQMLANPQIHFQDGTFEEWNIGVDEMKADLQEEIEKLEGWLKELLNERKSYEGVELL